MFYRVAQKIVRGWLRVWFRVTVVGQVPEDGALLLCANHTSYYDPAVIGAFCNRPLTYMGKKELFSVPLLRGLIRALGAFPVDRGNSLSAVKTTLTILKQQKSTLIFPEGTRNKTGGRLEPKAGAVMIASRAGVPIVPVHICSDYRIFSPLTVVFGEPMSFAPENGTKADAQELDSMAHLLMDTIFSLQAPPALGNGGKS